MTFVQILFLKNAKRINLISNQSSSLNRNVIKNRYSLIVNEYRLTARLLEKMFYIKIEKDVQIMKDLINTKSILMKCNSLKISHYCRVAKNMELWCNEFMRQTEIYPWKSAWEDRFFLTSTLGAFHLGPIAPALPWF